MSTTHELLKRLQRRLREGPVQMVRCMGEGYPPIHCFIRGVFLDKPPWVEFIIIFPDGDSIMTYKETLLLVLPTETGIRITSDIPGWSMQITADDLALPKQGAPSCT